MRSHVTDASTLPVQWITSSFSGARNNCVQTAILDRASVAVRDSKHPQGPAFVFRAAAWSTFTKAVTAGAFGQ